MSIFLTIYLNYLRESLLFVNKLFNILQSTIKAKVASYGTDVIAYVQVMFISS